VPTYETAERFQRDLGDLAAEDRARFQIAVAKFVEDLQAGRQPRAGLRVKGVQGAPGLFEMTWAPDGRATFQYGAAIREGEAHVIWRRIGSHDVIGPV
jgi:hypothetical protein